MAKVIDITEKLSFEENPKLVIKGKEYEVNADAMTALRVMGLVSGDMNPESIVEAFSLIFTEESQKRLNKLHLKFGDYKIVVLCAIQLIVGDAEEAGE